MPNRNNALSQLNEFLTEINRFDNLQKWGYVAKPSNTLGYGTFNVIKKSELPKVTLKTESKESKTANVVIASSRAEDDKTIHNNPRLQRLNQAQKDHAAAARKKDILNSQALLQEKMINSPFVSSQLYYDDQGNRIELQAASSLHAYFSKHGDNPVSPEIFKTILAQMILGIEALHKNGIVHRDIKPLNYLVFETSNGILVKVSDLDSILEINKINGKCVTFPPHCTGTKAYRRNDLSEYHNHKAWKSKEAIIREKDFRIWDAFALGVSVEDLIEFLPVTARSKEEFEALTHLVDTLKNEKFLNINLLLTSVAKDKPIDTKKLSQDKPTLIKQGDQYFIYGNTDGGHWQLTKLDPKVITNALPAIRFPAEGNIGDLPQHVAYTKLYHHIADNNAHTPINNLVTLAKENPIFGKTSDERAAFFNKIARDAKAFETTFDDYVHQSTAEKSDAFYLLPLFLKELSLDLKSIRDTLASIAEREEQKIPIPDYEQLAIYNKIKSITEKIRKEILNDALKDEDQPMTLNYDISTRLEKLSEALCEQAKPFEKTAQAFQKHIEAEKQQEEKLKDSLLQHLTHAQNEFTASINKSGMFHTHPAIEATNAFIQKIKGLSAKAMEKNIKAFLANKNDPNKESPFKPILQKHYDIFVDAQTKQQKSKSAPSGKSKL